MGIGADQRNYMQKSLLEAIDQFYGDVVPNLRTFIAKRRATFLAKLEKQVDAVKLRQEILEAREVAGRAQGVLTKLKNERTAKEVELRAQHDKELADLKALHQKQITELIARSEPHILSAKENQDKLAAERDAVERRAYFTALAAEDDGRYVPKPTIEAALTARVDEYIERNLMQDEDGAAVQKRVQQEKLAADAVWLAKDMVNLRDLVLGFIRVEKLPKITMEAWLIEQGEDLMPK